MADRLARRFQVITIDNRGIGASDAPPGPYSTRTMAATAIARRVGMPRQRVTLLEGESLVNDATALVAYRLAVGRSCCASSASWPSSRCT